MQPSKERIYNLLKSYTNRTATEDERRELYAWAADTPDDSELKNYIKELIEKNKTAPHSEVDWEKMYRRILEESGAENTVHRIKRMRWLRVAAAVLFLVMGAGAAYLFVTDNNKEAAPVIAKTTAPVYKNDIKPGGQKAILKAGSGSVVLTSSDTSFTLAGNKVEINNGDVKIAEAKPVEYTLIVPRGGTYSLLLADGTKVWLNAASKLVYPSIFTKNTREVRLIGEAYFDVATDAEHPFVVHTGDKKITVLGTQFNVHAYEDEPYSATLINGKVAVKEGNTTLVLQPGEQARANGNGRLILNKQVDLAGITAWKNGYFRFDKANIHSIMGSLSRWYDIDVKYVDDLSGKYFGAIISRDNNISKILNMLEATGEVHFEIQGKTVRVSDGEGVRRRRSERGMERGSDGTTG